MKTRVKPAQPATDQRIKQFKEIKITELNDEKTTPQKIKIIKVKASKTMLATKSTIKKMSASNQIKQLQGEKQIRLEGMNEVSKNLFTGKSKKIKKQSKKINKTQEYQNFNKFLYEKLKQEHPNWKAEKITHIISLLWKKRKMDSNYYTEKEVEQAYEKIMNGKSAFKEFKIKNGTNEKKQIEFGVDYQLNRKEIGSFKAIGQLCKQQIKRKVSQIQINFFKIKYKKTSLAF